MTRATAYATFFFMDMTTDFARNGYSKNRLICHSAGEPTHAITALLSNSLLSLMKLSGMNGVAVWKEI